jgi:hypothetical protein
MIEPQFNHYEQLSKLRQNLIDYFNDEELRTLCFDLGVDYEGLPAQGKVGKARELISELVRRERISDFVNKCSQLRPNVVWKFVLETPQSNQTTSLDEMFREAAHYQVKGDLGYALQLYRQLRQIAPTYPRIDAAISAVEQEMRAPYVDSYGRVQEAGLVGHIMGGLPNESLLSTLLVSSIIIQWLGYLCLFLIREPLLGSIGLICYPVLFGVHAVFSFVMGRMFRSRRIIVLSLIAGLSTIGIFVVVLVWKAA